MNYGKSTVILREGYRGDTVNYSQSTRRSRCSK